MRKKKGYYVKGDVIFDEKDNLVYISPTNCYIKNLRGDMVTISHSKGGFKRRFSLEAELGNFKQTEKGEGMKGIMVGELVSLHSSIAIAKNKEKLTNKWRLRFLERLVEVLVRLVSNFNVIGTMIKEHKTEIKAVKKKNDETRIECYNKVQSLEEYLDERIMKLEDRQKLSGEYYQPEMEVDGEVAKSCWVPFSVSEIAEEHKGEYDIHDHWVKKEHIIWYGEELNKKRAKILKKVQDGNN